MHLFPYELMLAEAEEVAHRAGAAFAGLSYVDVSQDVELLACIGDPDFMDDINVCEKNEYDQCKSSAEHRGMLKMGNISENIVTQPWYASAKLKHQVKRGKMRKPVFDVILL